MSAYILLKTDNLVFFWNRWSWVYRSIR